MRRPAFTLAALIWAAAPRAVSADGWVGRLPGPSAARALLDEDVSTREAAAVTLGRRGAPTYAVQALSAALQSENHPLVRRAIVASLARRGDPDAVPALARALADIDVDEGEADRVALALGVIATPDAVRALAVAVGQPRTADAAAAGLARAGPAAAAALLRLAATPAPPPEAVRALGASRDARAAAALVPLLLRDDEDVRLAALDALAQLGDERTAAWVAEQLGDPSPLVQRAAIEALGRTGGREHAGALARFAGEGASETRRAALRALAEVDPEGSVPAIARALGDRDEEVRRIAEDVALGLRHPAAVGLLRGLLRDDARADAAAAALAGIDGEAGVQALARDAAGDPAASGTRAAARGLAIAIRRRGLDAEEAGPWLRLVRERAAPGDTEMTFVFRALGRDPFVAPWLARGLASPRPERRAACAWGIELLGEGGATAQVRRALTDAVARETDEEAFRREAAAAVAIEQELPVDVLARFAESPETAPEALAATAIALRRRGGASAPSAAGARGRGDEPAAALERERARRRLREALAHREPRVRAGAAIALALSDEPGAGRALCAALDDARPEVRLAATRALAALAPPETTTAIAERLRVEDDPRVAAALRDAAVPGRPVPPFARGDEVLRVRVASGPGAAAGRFVGVPLDVVLPDGRWLRLRTLPDGNAIVADLPSGEADVRLGIAP